MRLSGPPAGREKFKLPPDLQPFKFAEAQLNKGMITSIDGADIDLGACQFIQNGVVRFDKLARRRGVVLLLPVAPDGNPVLRMDTLKTANNTVYTFRFTPTTVHNRGTLGWTALTGTLTGDESDYIESTVVMDQMVFANNGADVIQVIDPLLSSFGPLGNAPPYRYITGFFNRVVGANRRNENEVEVGWSGDGNIEEWDPEVDETAGSSPIMESPSDLSDFITGLFSWTNIGVLLRERSVWTIQKQAIPQNPFFFSTSVPGIGCDCPHSAQIVGSSIGWLDRRTATVYLWTPGQQPQAIGRPIERSILDNIKDPKLIFSSYNPVTNEYAICIPEATTGYVAVWTFNLRNNAWTKNVYFGVTSIDDVEIGSAGLTIDQLGTQAIESLTGTINELSLQEKAISSRVYGRSDGTLVEEDNLVDIDEPHPDENPEVKPPGEFETIIVSKEFTIPRNDIYIAEIRIEYRATRPSTMVIDYSKSGGSEYSNDWQTFKSVTPVVIGTPQLLIVRRMVKCRQFAWRLRAKAGDFEILSYEVHCYPSAYSDD